MPPNLRACIYVLVALCAGYMLCTHIFKHHRQDINKITTGWVFITLFVFLIPSPPVYFLLLMAVLFALAPAEEGKRFQFFCALLPATPMNIVWRVSLPGIETLIWMDHVKLLSLALLVPLWLRSKPVSGPPARDADVRRSYQLFTVFLLYLLLTIMLNWRGNNITSVMRISLENFLSPLIIILMINRICRDRAMINSVLFGLLVSGVFVALISCVEQVTKWKLYNEVSRSFIYWEHFSLNVRDIRWGMMRTPATMGPIPLGYFMSLCIIIGLYFSGLHKRGDDSYGGSVLVTGLFIVGLVFSGSRGAWMIAGLMLCLLLLFDKKFKAFRTIAAICVIFVAFSASAILDHLAQSDPYGTFQYRIDLFNNSLIVIKDNFFFGDVDFRSHPALEASRQGEGIIDVVNVYLSVALTYGVPALIMLLYVIVSALKGLMKSRAHQEQHAQTLDFEWQLRVVLVMIVGGIAMVSTVSFVDRIPHYLWMTLAIGICLLGVSADAAQKKPPATTAL